MKTVKQIILENAMYYDATMNDMRLNLFVEELKNCPVDKLEQAFALFRKEPGRRTLPMPADVLSKANPQETPNSKAIEAASRIIESVTRFGWTNADAAQHYIGSLGWRVVQGYGGWGQVCNLLNADNTSYYKQDFVKSAVASLEREVLGLTETPPTLESPEKLEKVKKLLEPVKRVSDTPKDIA